MRFIADLHIHSYLSRATSKDLNLEGLYRTAQNKGITVVATGDFTHPKWLAELKEKLVPAEPGLFKLKDELARVLDQEVPLACQGPVRFLLSVEISSIYKKDGKVRKVHNLVYAPDFEVAERIATRLGALGNITSDGRPILGLDSRNLLEITLESSPDAFLIPAHIWTPWFSALGSQSGFDAIAHCFGDLSDHIFAVETGLSSDPAMNWRLSQLDRYALISNSDAHSPDKLGREANLFNCDMSYFAMRDALRDKHEQFLGTMEFFPEEGKYHYDGHRKCDVVLEPEEARANNMLCPVCGKRLTEGVMGRVVELADRDKGFKPEHAQTFQSLIPLKEVLGEVLDVGPSSQKVGKAYQQLLTRVGSELSMLSELPFEDIDRHGPPLLGEAIRRMRAGQVHVAPGFDGEYGVIRTFSKDERTRLIGQRLFGFATAPDLTPSKKSSKKSVDAVQMPSPSASLVAPNDGINHPQQLAIEHADGPLLLLAGPGTGKTRTIVSRISHLIRHRGVSPRAITAITFTRKAAQELQERLHASLGDEAALVGSKTFHALCIELLQAYPEEANLRPDFILLDSDAQLAILKQVGQQLGIKTSDMNRAKERISWHKSHLLSPESSDLDLAPLYAAYQHQLQLQNAVDFDDLIVKTVALLCDHAHVLQAAQERARHLFVDEYQDINQAQYRLIKQLAPSDINPNFVAVGDPDQAIYGFRGSNPSFFENFVKDYPTASTIVLTHNYRSSHDIIVLATAVISEAKGRTQQTLIPRPRVNQHKPEIVQLQTAKEEAEWIAKHITQAMGGLSSLTFSHSDATSEQALAFHDIAILTRTAAQMDIIAEAFQNIGIPYERVTDPLTEDVIFEPQKVKLLTLHAAKGLEFLWVYIAGCEEGLLPLNTPWLQGDLEEERRLFYVGITRAKQRLICTTAQTRLLWGQQLHLPMSQFLSTLSDKIAKKIIPKRASHHAKQLSFL